MPHVKQPFHKQTIFPKYMINLYESFKSKRILGGTIISLFAIYSKVLNRGGNLFQIWLAGLFLEFETP